MDLSQLVDIFLHLDKHLAAVVDTYGWILTEEGKVAAGLEALSKAVKRAPDNPDIRYHHAAALARSGEGGRAMGLLANLMKSNPDFSSRAEAEQLRRELAGSVAAGAN